MAEPPEDKSHDDDERHEGLNVMVLDEDGGSVFVCTQRGEDTAPDTGYSNRPGVWRSK